MLIKTPKDPADRTKALNWLDTQGVRHMRLFQAVSIDDAAEAERFIAWMKRDHLD